MRRVFIKKAVTAGGFTAMLFLGAVLNMHKTAGTLETSIKADLNKQESASTIISHIDGIMSENAYGKYAGIETYGYIQRVLDKKEENNFEVIKDKEDFLHLSYFETKAKETEGFAKETALFKKALDNQGTKVLYVMTPDKYMVGETVMEPGLPYNYANETADSLIGDLARVGVDSLDFRQELKDSGIAYDRMFYRTDHHWTMDSAFFAFTRLVDQLSTKYGVEFEDVHKYIDKSNYNVITYTNSFLGSLGRKTGSLYSGVDDDTLIYPKFETDYTFTAQTYDNEIHAEGRFEEALLNHDMLRHDKGRYDVTGDCYSSYLYGNQGITHITNNNQPNGPKILLVKDSFLLPVAAFLSTVCSDVYLVDPRYYDGNISEYASSIEDLDAALISFYPQNIEEEFFRLNEKR